MEEKNLDGDEIDVHQDEDGEIWFHFIGNATTIMILSKNWDKMKKDLIAILETF